MSTKIAGRGLILHTGRRAEPLRGLLEQAGFDVRWEPLVDVQPTGAAPPPGHPDVVLVTSAAAVGAADLPSVLTGARLGAVGEATAAALRACGLHPTIVGVDGAVAALAALAPTPDEVLWHVGAEQLAEPLARWLADRVGHTERWVVYRRQTAKGVAWEELLDGVDVVVLTSPSGAEALFAAGPPPPHLLLVAIGHTTAAAIHQAGAEPAAVAAAPTPTEVVQAVVDALRRPSGG
jgi:uroporphyrinogen-III synthase